MTGPLTSTGAVQADPEALLKAANILRTQATRMDDSSQRYIHQLRVGECGTDDISKWASMAFNEKIQPMSDNIQQFIGLLELAASHLTENAKKYGATEQQIQASFVRPDPGQTLQQQIQQKMGQHSISQAPTSRLP